MAERPDLRNTCVVKKTPVREVEVGGTRSAIARAILEGGPATAVDLSQKLEITPAGFRRHLDALVEEGVLEAREPHLSTLNAAERGRGRPSKVFVITDSGREKFEHSYDDLAVSALRFMSSKSGSNLVEEFARTRAEDIAKRARPKVQKAHGVTAKSQALADFLSTDGFAANVHSKGIGEELCQNHCPIAHVAAAFPELCDAETAAFSELLGTHVQRLATIAHGDGVCTTFIPSKPNASKASSKESPKAKEKVSK